MNLNRILAPIFLAAGITVALPVYAWYSVYDSNQYTQNYIKAQKSIEIAITSAEQLQVMETQASLTHDSVASFSDMDAMTEVSNEIELYNQLKSADLKLLDSVTEAMRLFEDIKAQWGTSNVSFESFCAQLAGSAIQRDKALVSSFRSSTAEIQQVAQRRKQIIDALGTAVGQTQAIQAAGAAVDAIIGQNQQIIALMMAEGADTVADKNSAKAQVEYSRQVMREYEARKHDAATGFR